MNELKPSGYRVGMYLFLDWDQAVRNARNPGLSIEPLYAVPDTHRVVSVELLQIAVDMIWGRCDEDDGAVKELLAIIDNKGAT